MRAFVSMWVVLVALVGCQSPMAPADAPVTPEGGLTECTELAGVWSVRVSRCGPAIVPSDVTISVTRDCAATLASPPGKGLPPINGMAVIDAAGGFGATDMVVGSSTLSCTGAASGPSRYVITCEPGCSITLER